MEWVRCRSASACWLRALADCFRRFGGREVPPLYLPPLCHGVTVDWGERVMLRGAGGRLMAWVVALSLPSRTPRGRVPLWLQNRARPMRSTCRAWRDFPHAVRGGSRSGVRSRAKSRPAEPELWRAVANPMGNQRREENRWISISECPWERICLIWREKSSGIVRGWVRWRCAGLRLGI